MVVIVIRTMASVASRIVGLVRSSHDRPARAHTKRGLSYLLRCLRRLQVFHGILPEFVLDRIFECINYGFPRYVTLPWPRLLSVDEVPK